MERMSPDQLKSMRRSAWRTWGIAVIVAVLVVLPACRKLGTARPVAVALGATSDTLDPHLHNETVLWSLLANFYEGLTRFDGEMRVVPGLAASWERLDPYRTRFELRAGASFHDGSPVSPDDVAASLSRARAHPRSRVGHHLMDVEEVTSDGERAVVIRTGSPSATLVNRLALVMVVPAALSELEEIRDPMGTGPYRFVRQTVGGTIVARAVRGSGRRPQVKSVHFQMGAPLETRLALLTSGTVDVLGRLPDHALRDLERHPAVRVLPQPRLSVQYLAVVPGAAPEPIRDWLADPRVRRAFLLGLNRWELVNRGYLGNGTVASQLVHPVVFGFDSSLTSLPYDPAAARRLLEEAGPIPDHELVLGFGEVQPAIIDQIVRDLTALGLRVSPRQMMFGELWQRAFDQELPLVYHGRTAVTGDAAEILNVNLATRRPESGWGLGNMTGYSNPKVDDLLEVAEGEDRPEVRLGALQQAQRLILQDLPILPLTIRFGHVAVSPRIDLTPRYDEWLLAEEFRWR